jgi:hypothetical protein
VVNQLEDSFDRSSWFCMNDEDLIRESGDEFVSAAGSAGVSAARGLLEAGDDEEATAFERRSPFRWNPHFSK